MSKLIPMDEAAQILGMSVEQLTELRSNNEVFGYRDGSNWKFKMTELERVADELGISLNTTPVDGISDSSLNLDSEADMISLDDSGLLKSDDAVEDSGLLLEGDSDIFGSSENLLSDDDDQLAFGSSSLKLSAGGGTDSSADILDESPENGDSPSDTGKMLNEAGDDLLMSEEDLFSDEISLADSSSFGDSADLSSDFEDSSDLLLDDSDSSTEITLESNKSGINLSANDSGIVLDEPMGLGDDDSSALELELPEDDEMIVLEEAGSDMVSLSQEDEFNLTPLEVSDIEDESSGSQVIALEDSEIYADSESGIMGSEEVFEAQPALLEDPLAGDFGGTPYGDPSMVPGAQFAPSGMMAAQLPESPYTVWQIVSLSFVSLILMAGAMVAYNLAQNMWIADDQIIGSSVLNFFLKLTGMNN